MLVRHSLLEEVKFKCGYDNEGACRTGVSTVGHKNVRLISPLQNVVIYLGRTTSKEKKLRTAVYLEEKQEFITFPPNADLPIQNREQTIGRGRIPLWERYTFWSLCSHCQTSRNE